MLFRLLLRLSLAPSVDLTWQAPAQCPDEAAVNAQIDAFLEGSVVPEEEVRADVEVIRERTEWVATLQLSIGGDSEVRELRDPACDLVATASAFVIAAAVAPEFPVRDEAKPYPVSEDQTAPTNVASPQSTADPVAEPSSRGVRGFARLVAALDLGSLARPAVGPRLSAGLDWGRWRLEFPATLLPAGRASTGSGSVATTLWIVGARGCRAFGTEPVEVPLCVGVEAGRFVARGRGFDDASTARAPWVAPTLDCGLRWTFLDPFGLNLAAGVVVPAHRPRFDVEGFGLAHRSNAAAFRAELGFEVRFP